MAARCLLIKEWRGGGSSQAASTHRPHTPEISSTW